jgi:hypothetical protein
MTGPEALHFDASTIPERADSTIRTIWDGSSFFFERFSEATNLLPLLVIELRIEIHTVLYDGLLQTLGP